jgi:hypothetical protein
VARFGEYVVYVDESGDHSLAVVNPEFPLFVLAFCIFPVVEYVSRVVPAIEQLKFDFFGHDMVLLHERDIRKSTPPFDILRVASVRESFQQRLTEIIAGTKFGVVACVIDKNEFIARRGSGMNPYHVALEFGLERVFYQLQDRHQVGRKTHVIFESRGKNEDAQLELEFRRIQTSGRANGLAQTLEFRCAPKSANSSGLQLADMIARPIGLHVLRPNQSNRAWDTLFPKLVRSQSGQVNGYGLKVYP